MIKPAPRMRLNPPLAYVIGVITTDGCLSSDKRHITISSADTQLLETIKRCLYKTNNITLNSRSSLSKKDSYRIQFGDVKLYKMLIQIGLTSGKSLTLGEIQIEDRLFRDFLRGHLDGDGSIITYTDKYLQHISPNYIYQRLYVKFISASRAHIVRLRESIVRLTQLRGALSSYLSPSQEGTHPLFILRFAKKESIKLLNWIYYKKELPCLHRKLSIARPYLNYDY